MRQPLHTVPQEVLDQFDRARKIRERKERWAMAFCISIPVILVLIVNQIW